MGIYQYAAWGVILSLSLMVVGGLMLWAYGARRREGMPRQLVGPEAEAARAFHQSLARWFFFYGIGIVFIGAVILFWASDAGIRH